MQCDHDGFKIEAFEAGKGLWHARIRRTDLEPVIIDGVSFPALEVGFAWYDPETGRYLEPNDDTGTESPSA